MLRCVVGGGGRWRQSLCVVLVVLVVLVVVFVWGNACTRLASCSSGVTRSMQRSIITSTTREAAGAPTLALRLRPLRAPPPATA